MNTLNRRWQPSPHLISSSAYPLGSHMVVSKYLVHLDTLSIIGWTIVAGCLGNLMLQRSPTWVLFPPGWLSLGLPMGSRLRPWVLVTPLSNDKLQGCECWVRTWSGSDVMHNGSWVTHQLWVSRLARQARFGSGYSTGPNVHHVTRLRSHKEWSSCRGWRNACPCCHCSCLHHRVRPVRTLGNSPLDSKPRHIILIVSRCCSDCRECTCGPHLASACLDWPPYCGPWTMKLSSTTCTLWSCSCVVSLHSTSGCTCRRSTYAYEVRALRWLPWTRNTSPARWNSCNLWGSHALCFTNIIRCLSWMWAWDSSFNLHLPSRRRYCWLVCHGSTSRRPTDIPWLPRWSYHPWFPKGWRVGPHLCPSLEAFSLSFRDSICWCARSRSFPVSCFVLNFPSLPD